MLALAHKVELEVEAGRVKDYATAALRLGISRGRMAQVMALLNLAPGIQVAILTDAWPASERRLRDIIQQVSWESQVSMTRQLAVRGPWRGGRDRPGSVLC